LPVTCEVLRLASRTRREPRHRGDRHRRDKGEAHQKQPKGEAWGPVKPADALCTATTTCLRCTSPRLARDLLASAGGEKNGTVRPLVLFALIASVACTASPRPPDAAATLGPLPTLPPFASPEPLPTITIPPLVLPSASTLPLPNVMPLPTALALPTAVPIPNETPAVLPLPIATRRPLSTIPGVIRPAAPIPTPGLLPLPTSLPILPPVR